MANMAPDANLQLESSESDTLTDRVYRQLKKAIKIGTFKPGQKLTSRAIATALDVSATPAREALTRLVSEDALEMTGPKTIVVPYLSPERYEEIIMIRTALEGLAAEKAAESADSEFIDELELTHLAFVTARSNQEFAAALRLNESFHFALYRQSGQPRLVSIIENLWVSIGPSLSLLYPSFSDRQDGTQPHNDAIAALRNGDKAGVRAAIERDISTGYSKIRPMLEKPLQIDSPKVIRIS